MIRGSHNFSHNMTIVNPVTVPSTAITRLTGATTNAERKDALQVIGRMCDQNQALGKNDLRRLSDVIQKLITTGQDKILAHVFDVIPKILKAYANEDPMKEWLYILLTGNFNKNVTIL